MMESPTPIDHIDRWRRIVAARREQHDAVCKAQQRTTDDYWARRAEGFAKFVREAASERDPFLAVVLRHLRATDSVLDIGAGTGRHSLPLAGQVQRVVALDPSPAMLAFLREDAVAQRLTNVEVVEGAWPDAASLVAKVDIAISAHVLYPIEDIVAFLRAMDGAARRLCFLNLMCRQAWFDQLGLWEALNNEPRRPQPTHIDAVNVLHQLGGMANVEIAWLDITRAFDGIDDAVERVAESAAAGEDPVRRERLRAVLAERLTPIEGGRLALPLDPYPVATVWWEAGAL